MSNPYLVSTGGKVKRALLSTVFWTEYQVDPAGLNKTRAIRFQLSDGDLGILAHKFENRYKLMLSGSTVLSVVVNKKTVSMVRVEEFEPKSLIPKKYSHLMGPEIDLASLPKIEDKRSSDMKGHPTRQIPKPHTLDPR